MGRAPAPDTPQTWPVSSHYLSTSHAQQIKLSISVGRKGISGQISVIRIGESNVGRCESLAIFGNVGLSITQYSTWYMHIDFFMLCFIQVKWMVLILHYWPICAGNPPDSSHKGPVMQKVCSCYIQHYWPVQKVYPYYEVMVWDVLQLCACSLYIPIPVFHDLHVEIFCVNHGIMM